MYISPSGAATDKIPPANNSREVAALILIHPPMPELGQRRPLLSDVVVVGRDESADLTVARLAVSRCHAELRHQDGEGWVVADMGSTNGTFLNEGKVDDAALNNGDHIQFGDAIFKFVVGAAAMEFHDKMVRLTNLDGLTALYNQRHFCELVYEKMAKAKRVESDMAMIVLDVDGLSALNEERGRACGDLILKSVAKRCTAKLSAGRICARIEGGEFALFLPGTELDSALLLAEELRESIANTSVSFEGRSISCTASMGVAASAEGELSAPELIAESKKQLLAAKERGHNSTCP